MELRDRLSSRDPGVRAEAFEDAVLAALSWATEQVPSEAIAAAYRRLSDALNSAEVGGGPSGPLFRESGLDAVHVSAVWGLIYAARSFQVASALLSELPPPPGPVVELGAGWGPFGLAAALRGSSPVTLVDVSKEAMAFAPALFSACGLAPPICRVASGPKSSLSDAAAVGAAFSFGEMVRGGAPGADLALMRRWLSGMSAGSRLYLLEPGTRASARRLQALRDQPLGGRILGPCVGAVACPLLADARDWCHFTWAWPPGPWGRRLGDLAGRRWQEIHVSWLVAEAGEAPPIAREERLRVLEVGRGDRNKAMVRLCGPTGTRQLTVLRRNRDAYDAVQSLRPGDLIELRPGATTLRGDGERVEEADAFARLWTLE